MVSCHDALPSIGSRKTYLNFLLSDVFVTYDPNPSLDAEAIRIGKHIINLWAKGKSGRERHTYVNYAFGDEPLEQMYGSEP